MVTRHAHSFCDILNIMNRKLVFIGLIVAVAVAVGAYFFSVQTPRKTVPLNKIQVTTSFYPLAYIASQVGGLRVSVKDLLPLGGEPHDFEPSLRDLALLSESDLFLYNGADFEPWVEKWKKGSFAQPSKVVNMVDELGMRSASLISRDGVIDPHVWLSPVLFKQKIEIVRDALIIVDPVNADEYRSNAASLDVAINGLDQRFRDGLRSCTKKSVITSHDAFEYLAREYNFGVIPIAGISPNEEPSPKVLASIIKTAREKNIQHIFFETKVGPKLSEVIAREIGGTTLVLNPLESLTPYEVQLKEDYITVMEKNLNNLRTALSCM